MRMRKLLDAEIELKIEDEELLKLGFECYVRRMSEIKKYIFRSM